MTDCCQEKSCDLELMAKRHAKVLWAVLIINAVMFFAEMIAGIRADSTALLGDSLDMLGDAIAYSSSLLVIRSGAAAKAKSARLKGALMLLLGAAILGRAIFRLWVPELPETELMTLVGFAALTANGFCLLLLNRHRSDDINMKSVWICSRNDIIANVCVIGAAAIVSVTHSPLPDLAVGIALSVLFINSALSVLRDSKFQMELSAK